MGLGPTINLSTFSSMAAATSSPSGIGNATSATATASSSAPVSSAAGSASASATAKSSASSVKKSGEPWITGLIAFVFVFYQFFPLIAA